MRLTASSALVGALLACAASVSAGSHNARHNKRHHELAAREPKPEPEPVGEKVGNITDSIVGHGLEKRGNDARFTFYDVGLGACGKTNVPSDFIVALNTPQYGGGSPGPQCFKMITISYGGKQTQAQIMDQCPGCPYRGLDFSRGLFDFFASESEGVIYGDWWFSDGGDNGGGDDKPSSSSSKWTPPSSTWQPPKTSSSKWTPTSTWSSTSSTWSSSSSSSHSSSSSSTSSNSTVVSATLNLSSGAASGLAVATGSGAPEPTGTAGNNVYDMNLAIIEMGALINAGHAH